MNKPDPIPPGRYRRRILGLGALAFVVTFAIGAAIFIPVVQRDLEERVEAEFSDAGFEGVRASFSGQDGTLRACDTPFDDPAAAETLGEGVTGVRVVALDASCSGDAREVSDVADEAPSSEAPTTEPAVTEPAATTTTTTEAPPNTEPQVDGIVEIVEGDPLFSQLAGLLVTAGLDGPDAFGGDGPFTLLAPTDAAFDAAFEELGADAFDALTSDADTLRSVLLHHATEGTIMSSDFVAGDLEMLDGGTVTVDPDASDGITFTSDELASGVDDPATQLDIEASNGVLHAIDRLLIPEGLDVGEPDVRATATIATLEGGQLTLGGVIANEEQRAAIVAAVQAQFDPSNLIDQLMVDPDAALTSADIDRFAALVGAMPTNLGAGEAVLDAGGLSLVGFARNDDSAAVITQVGADQAATVELAPREVADGDSAAALQAELNEFVRDNPILFEPNSAQIAAEATAVIDQLAARATRLDGTAITIVGHTDSDGNPVTNQTLSELRALSVLDALVQRGADASTLSSAGRGSTEPLLDESGAEDKAASRRVEFVVDAS